MLGSEVGRGVRCRVGFALLGAMLLFAGVASRASAQGQEDTPPIVSNGMVTPANLPHDGGTINISADVTDDLGIMMVYAEVLDQNGNPNSVQLLFQGGNSYGGSFNVPPNLTDAPVSYFVNITATDTNGAFDTETAGAVQVDAQPPFDEAPVVGAITVEPRNLPSGGGAVTIRAGATDNLSVVSVKAVITAPGSATTEVELQPVSASEFEGVFHAPANGGATPVQYAISIVATDDLGQEGTGNGGNVTVAGAPPADQNLKVTPGKLNFGRVFLGRRVRLQLVLRNSTRRSGAAISGIVVAPGTPFRLVGASSQGGATESIAFTLRPGERRTYTVEFRPTSAGAFQGELVVQRSDGGQAGFAVHLTGRGQTLPRR